MNVAIPPRSLNHRLPAAEEAPTASAASSLLRPFAISCQNNRSTSRRSDGFPGDFISALPVNSVIHPAGLPIATPVDDVLQRPVDFANGDLCGDELPDGIPVGEGRQRWLRAARQRLDRKRARRAEPIARSRPTRFLEAKARLEEELAVEVAANRAYESYREHGVMKNGRRFGARPKPYVPPEQPDGKINLTDLDSRLVHGMRGWVQGCNVQAACNEQHPIIAAEVMTASPDFGHLEPMMTAARSELQAAGVRDTPELVVADAGYWHQDQMDTITADGIAVLIPPDSTRRKNPRPGWTGGAYDFMRFVLATEHGKALYKQRAQLIEPIFGNTKHNRGFTRFARRGRSAARTEWRLIASTHNLLKLHRHFTAPA